ncbi:MSHA biogenesis protein MshK [Janthinobacterium sp. RB2R34]|uniref:MSHA biogenesis protein MshK n=1 Tax=Janthinobacterium sp. RB2R34 TaxID=3424193 RepID=UPI003F205848
MMRQHLIAGLLLVGVAAGAQALDDPTRPPASLLAPSQAKPVIPGKPKLQSVLVASQAGGRRLAVIDGQIVRVGSKVGDAVVLEIRDTLVVVRRGKRHETFRLYPETRKADRQTGGKQE